ncbi:hypothetical protein GCM10027289_21640 [Tsukamurella serpentis]
MENTTASSAIVVLDGTDATARLVGELTQAGTAVTAVGATFRDVVAVLSGDVYVMVADVTDPEQWDAAVARAQARHGVVGQVVDPSGKVAARAA